MAQPTRSSLAITDPVLSNFALDFGRQKLVTEGNMGMGMTPDFIFPRVPHTQPGLTGEYYTYNFRNRFQLATGLRKTGNYPQVKWDVSSATYRLEDYGFSKPWDEQDEKAGFPPMDLDQDSVEVCTDMTLLEYANDVITLVTTSGNFDAATTNTNTAATLGGAWDTSSTDIVGQIATVKQVIHKNCGVMPDRIVLGSDVWFKGILVNDNIIAGLQAQQKAGGLQDFDPVKAVCRTFFDLDGAVDTTLYDSANPGTTQSMGYLFGTNVLVFVSNARIERVKAMRLGMTVSAPGEFLRGYRWTENPKTRWRAVSFERSSKLVADDAGYLITSVVS
jgi:hypothetical protein